MNKEYEKGKMQGKKELAEQLIEIGEAVKHNDSKAGAYDAMIYKCRSYAGKYDIFKRKIRS